jgi:hypothetical protein
MHINGPTKTCGPLADTAPLFASVWLALFNELRKNNTERRLEAPAGKKNTKATEKK